MRLSTPGTSECFQEKAPVPVGYGHQRERIKGTVSISTDFELSKQLP